MGKTKILFILCGCEESQAVAIKFREQGHMAFSCDLKPSSGGRPDIHLQMDVFKAIAGGKLTLENGDTIFIKEWNMAIFFPDCTFMTVSANKWLKDQPTPKSGKLVGGARREAQRQAIEFVKKLWDCGIHRIAIENPISVLSTQWRKPNQIIQPWMYGHGETKATCLWLKRLPRLNGFDVVEGREQRIFKMPPGPDRAAQRSKTFEGIAKQMSLQWSYFK